MSRGGEERFERMRISWEKTKRIRLGQGWEDAFIVQSAAVGTVVAVVVAAEPATTAVVAVASLHSRCSHSRRSRYRGRRRQPSNFR